NPSTPAPTAISNPPTTSINSSWNGSTINPSNLSSSNNPVMGERQQEPHTPPVTPQQQTIATAS
ncbi:unnamed protein product, partial [Rotaria socialis]